LIRPRRGELALDQIRRIIRLVAADGGSAFATAHNPLQPERSHQSFDATAGDGDAPLVFVASLNEWSEGHHLEPDDRFGHGWLEAVRAARR
jgi:hypothetical protein